MRLITLYMFTMVVVMLTAVPAASDIGEACIATVIEVSSNGEILIELNEGMEPGEYFTVPGESVYTSSGRHQELPLVGDTCLVTFLNGDKSQPVIFGFCYSNLNEHVSFRDTEDRRTNLPNGGKIDIKGANGRTSITLPSDLNVSVRGKNPGVLLTGSGSLLAKFADSIIFSAAYILATFHEIAKFEFGKVLIDSDTVDIRSTDVEATFDNGTLWVIGDLTIVVDGTVTIECDDVNLGGTGGKNVARKGDSITISKEELDRLGIEHIPTIAPLKGEISEGSETVKAVD